MSTCTNSSNLNNCFATRCTCSILSLHLFSDLHPLSRQTSIHNSTLCHPTSPTAPQTHNKHWIPLHPAPIRPGAGGGVRGQSSNRGQQEMAVLPGTRVLTSAPLHFSFLSFVPPHIHSWGMLVRMGPSLLLYTSHFFTTRNRPHNFCLSPNLFHIKMTSEDWGVNAGLTQSYLWDGMCTLFFFMTW